MLKKLLLAVALMGSASGAALAETVTILMEAVPDTEYVKTLVPEFTKATGIEVNLEIVNYAEMHTKLVPQLVASKGSYSAMPRFQSPLAGMTSAKRMKPFRQRSNSTAASVGATFMPSQCTPA